MIENATQCIDYNIQTTEIQYTMQNKIHNTLHNNIEYTVEYNV